MGKDGAGIGPRIVPQLVLLLRAPRAKTSGSMLSPPQVPRTPVPPAQAAAGVLPLDPRIPLLTASRPTLGPGTPAGEGLPGLPLPAQWQMQLLQLQAMQQAMASVPYTFTGQHPFQPPGFGVGDVFGPRSTSQPTAPGPSAVQHAHPGQTSGSDRDTHPPSLSSAEWQIVRRLREGDGEDKVSVTSGTSSHPRTPVPESDESDALTDHEDFMEVHASHGSLPLNRELRGSPARSAIADEPPPPVAAPRPPPSLSEGSQVPYQDFNDIRGDASAWWRLWLADKFKFMIPLRFHEILETIKRALGFPADPQASSAFAPSQAQARSLFQGVPPVAQSHRVTMPWDTMCHTTAKRDIKGLLDGLTKTLGEAVFSRKFPAAEKNEKP